MRYEVLIMLAVVGAINLVGRVLAKRAQSKAPAPAVPAPQPKTVAREPVIVRRARATPKQAAVAQPTVASATPKPSASGLGTIPVVPKPSGGRTPAPATARAVPKPPAAPAPGVAAKPRNRWNARTLRRAFVAGEILGMPVGQRL